MTQLTAIVLTYNEAEQIGACIDTLRFADRILVFDSHSGDDTVDRARRAGADVLQRPFENYADQRNAALEAVAGQTEWALFVDADERVSAQLAAEIQSKLSLTEYAGWKLPRHNYIFGKLTTGAGWYPDYQTRLLRAGKAAYDPQRQVHETVLLDGPIGALRNPITHYNYQDVAHFMRKQRRYVRYDARMLFDQGIQAKWRNFVLQPLRHFYWRFVTLKGYRDRWHGLRLCLFMSWYEYRKYRQLAQLHAAGKS